MAIYPKKNMSQPNQTDRVYLYLLGNLNIDRSNQAWTTEITYLPMAEGSAYLVATIAWYLRRMLSWRLSNTLDSQFSADALEDTIAEYGVPEIFNTDQGNEFTSEEPTGVLERQELQISMDGKGRWLDNVFVERLWRSVKYEEVYLNAYDNIGDARQSLDAYFRFYNEKRRHQSLDRQTPDSAYYQTAERRAA
jgi:putative transposase